MGTRPSNQSFTNDEMTLSHRFFEKHSTLSVTFFKLHECPTSAWSNENVCPSDQIGQQETGFFMESTNPS